MWLISESMGFRLPIKLRPAPNLIKIPFLRWLPGTCFIGPHATTPIKLSEVTGVLLHFKFLEDFFARVKTEARRKEHWDGASEYERYLAKLEDDPSLSFQYPGSVAYESSDQLVRLGLLREGQEWSRIRSTELGSGLNEQPANFSASVSYG
jgi:hypothetical protein